MSKIIKNESGDSVSFSKLSMQAFHSEKELREMEQQHSVAVSKAKNDADTIIADARVEADRITAAARKEAESIKAKAHEEGLQQGRQQVEQDFSKSVAAINNIKAMIDQNMGDIFRSVEQQTIDLVLAIAKKVVGYEVQINREIVLNVIQCCLAKTKEKNHVTVKVNPQELAMVEEKKECFQKAVRGLKAIDIVESELVLEGGCIIETSAGDINGDIDEQFQKIRDALTRD